MIYIIAYLILGTIFAILLRWLQVEGFEIPDKEAEVFVMILFWVVVCPVFLVCMIPKFFQFLVNVFVNLLSYLEKRGKP